MIVQIDEKDVPRATDILYESDIGKRYYPRKELLEKGLSIGIGKDQIFGYKNDSNELEGVVWYQHNGMFKTYPYLHMIAVDEGCRGKGIGRQLLEHFEKESLACGSNKIKTKTFLLVAHDNEVAQKMYYNAGYKELTEIESLFRIRMDEKLMYKVVV